MTSKISKSSLYSILVNQTSLSKADLLVILHNQLSISKMATYVIMKGDGTLPRRTMVDVNWVEVLAVDEWRLVSGFCYAYDNTQFSEMEWMEGSGQPNLLKPGNFDSSSEFGGLYKKENATDGDVSTNFAFLGGRNFWMSDKMPEGKKPDYIRIRSTATAPGQFPRELVVQKKVGTAWVTYGDVSFGGVAPASSSWASAAVTPLTPPAISVDSPHRHWRIMIVGCAQSHAYLLAQRLKLFNELGVDVTLTPGKTVTYTDQQGTTYAAANLFEDNASQWATNGGQFRHFIAIDLGSGNAAKVANYSLTVAGAHTAPTGWRIEFSDDGTNWKIADERLLQTWATNETKSFAIEGVTP